MQRIKMKDVAAAVGVSTMTVSRALRRDGRIAPETRLRILEAVARLGYVPDRIAAGFSTRKSGFIGVLVPSLNNAHFADTAAGLQTVLASAGLQLLLGYTNYDRQTEEHLVATMLERRPEAMVVTYDSHTDRTRRLLQESGVPVVEIWEMPASPIGHVVGFSNRHAAAEITRHLIENGRRRIAFVGEADDRGTRGAQRRKGFVDAMTEAGLDPHRRIAFGAPPIGMMQGREAMRALIERWPDTDAVLAVSDPCAYGALSACQIDGISVPDQIAIAGFGDFEISRCAVPALTTMSVHGIDIGQRAGELVATLLGQPATRTGEGSQSILIAPRLAIRGSTAG